MFYQFCELYDFKRGNNEQIACSSIIGSQMTTKRITAENMLINSENFMILCSWSQPNNYIFKIQKLLFKSKNIWGRNAIENRKEKPYNSNTQPGNSTSCFITNSQVIMCFTFIKSSTMQNGKYYSNYNV